MRYIHGGDIYRNQVEYDFSVNINPLGMPKGSIRAAQEGILLSGRYPDYRSEALCREIAGSEGVQPQQVLTGNGAAELIYALCFAIKPQKGMVTAPSFQEYETAILGAGGQVVYWDLREEEDFRLEEGVLEIIEQKIQLLFLCNPNNPTGNVTNRDLLIRIVEKCEKTGTFLCLDECFLPFLEDEDGLTLKHSLERFPHLLILRAFTKVYGMPGLRLGYLMSGNQALLAQIRSCLQPWNTSIPAQLAGIEALRDQEYLEHTRQLIGEEKNFLISELSKGLTEKIYASGANYIFFKSRRDLQEILLQKKILIRSCENYRNLSEGFFRIGVRTHMENKVLIRRWKEEMV